MADRQHAVNNVTEAPRRTPAGEALTSLVLTVVRLGTAFTAKGEALARPSGQTLARWVVMDAVAEAPATVAEVSRQFEYARQSVQRVADLLVADGLASYEDNPRHRRARLLRLTPAGRQARDAINVAQKAWSDELGARVGEADLRKAAGILERILAALRER